MKDPVKVARGRSARALGADFELRTRKDLEEKGWIVDKWSNNLFPLDNQPFKIGGDLKIAAAKHMMSITGTPLALGTGFPDFVCFRKMSCSTCYARVGNISTENYNIIGVESKTNGTLSVIEKEKCRWYLKKDIFKQIFIAEKTKVKGKVVIVYHDFEEKYGS